jgi:Family of unknown function (DUF5681)
MNLVVGDNLFLLLCVGREGNDHGEEGAKIQIVPLRQPTGPRQDNPGDGALDERAIKRSKRMTRMSSTSKGRWQKGQSGNPSGRPRRDHRIQELARSYGPDALATLHKIASEGTSESARVSAAIALLERGYGKPPQTLTHDGGGLIIKVVRFAELTVEPLPEIHQLIGPDEDTTH